MGSASVSAAVVAAALVQAGGETDGNVAEMEQIAPFFSQFHIPLSEGWWLIFH